jgi:hypothetical protein
MIGFLGFFCVFLWIGCSSNAPPPKPVAPPEPLHIKTLLVLPFQNVAQNQGENVIIQDRLSGNVFTTGTVSPEAEKVMAESVTALLKRRKDLTLLPESLADGAVSTILSREKGEIPEREFIAKIGASVGADAVLVGKIYRFRERDGTGFSVNSPASVAFELDLVQVSDSRLVWTGTFDETQQSLFENLFQWNTFWKRKAQWITAEQLAREGLDKNFETFPVK